MSVGISGIKLASIFLVNTDRVSLTISYSTTQFTAVAISSNQKYAYVE